MANKKNKVKFGLTNVHYAKIKDWVTDASGANLTPVYVDPVRLPGAVSISIDANGEEAVKAAEGLSSDIEGVMNSLAGDMQTALPTDFSVSGSMNDGYGRVAPLGININIESLAVREEADINRIAQQLYQLEQRAMRKKGLVYA